MQPTLREAGDDGLEDTFTQEISVSAGDLVQIYAKQTSVDTASVLNFGMHWYYIIASDSVVNID